MLLATLAACRSHDSGQAEPAEPPRLPPPEPEAPEPPDPKELNALMKDHFGLASQARDAIVRGRLEEAEAPLVWLGQHAFSKNMPESFRPHIDRMQEAARKAKSENTLQAAAQAVATMALECGACHTALRSGPKFEPSDWTELGDPKAQVAPRAALRERMHEELWAMERLWEGLVGPWDDAWREGSKSLRGLKGHSGVPAVHRARLEAVKALGQEASGLDQGAARAQLYGRVLAECGSCHASAGIDPGMVSAGADRP